MPKHWPWIMLFVGVCLGAALAQDQSQTLASRWRGARGVCVLLGDRDGALARELARNSELLIYSQLRKEEDVESARRAADEAGYYGTRIYVGQGDYSKISLADNLADVVLAVGEGAQASEAEVLRVLNPLGKALLGAKELTKPFPQGTDSWSHPYHGPDNNPLSTDQLARAPYLTQFLAKPMFCCQPEVTVAAGGRIFKAFGHLAFRTYQEEYLNTLYAFNGFNGTLLWKRKLKEGYMIHRNAFVASSDVLYLADDESCKLLDAATGELRGEIIPPEGSADGKVWKWMAVENGVIYALVGGKETDAAVKTAPADKSAIGGWPWGMWPGYDYKQPEINFGSGRTLLAVDAKTRKVLWSHREQEFLDGRALCMKNGRIYFYSPGKFLGCLNASTGKPLWKTSDAELLQAIGSDGKAQSFALGFTTTVYMKCTDKVLMFAGPQRPNMVAVSSADGKLLWKRENGNYHLILAEKCLYAVGPCIPVSSQKSLILDYAGKELGQFPARRACTRATGSVDSIFYRTQEGTLRWDLASGTAQHMAPMRPACQDGVIISDGLLHWGPWMCGCKLSLFGIICLGPAKGFDTQGRGDDSGRLEQAGGVSVPVKDLDAKAGDWPTYLGNNQRSGASSHVIPAKVAPLWEFKPASAYCATAPVTAGGLVFVGGSDGIVRALSSADGKLVWKAFTGGEIFFPPAIWKGRVYTGSNDGRVYAYEAATGRLLWRFRAAAEERLIPVYGRLASTWPVAGGVVVEEGVLYAASGIAQYDGTHVFALDAVTGKMKWHNSTSGILDVKSKTGISLCGSLSFKDNILSFPGGTSNPGASFDAATGEYRVAGGRYPREHIILFPREDWEPLTAFQRATAMGAIEITNDSKNGRDAVNLTVNLYNTKPSAQVNTEQPQWSRKIPPDCKGVVAVSNALLLLCHDPKAGAAGGRLLALKIQDGADFWSQSLPAEPAHWGLALDHKNRIFVSLEDGRVICLGKP